MKKLFTVIALSLCGYITNAQINGGKKLLVVVTNTDYALFDPNDHNWGCYTPEVADFYSVVKSYGFKWSDIDIVSPKGGNSPLIFDNEMYYSRPISAADESTMRAKLKNTLKPSEVNPDHYNVIYYAGGLSCLVDFPSATEIAEIAARIYEKGGKVGAVCDGISGLIPITLSNGKHLVDGVKIITNDYQKQQDKIDVAEELTNKGGLVSKTSPFYFSDKNIVTGKDVRPVQVTNALMKLLGTDIWPTGVASVQSAGALRCYPNPAGNEVHVELEQKNKAARYNIYNIAGQVISAARELTGTINISQLPAGKYILDVYTAEERFSTTIVKQ